MSETFTGKFVITFIDSGGFVDYPPLIAVNAGAVGFIAAHNDLVHVKPSLPTILVSYEVGSAIVAYVNKRGIPRMQLKVDQICDSKYLTARIPRFSSRGPSSITPTILKPDITAPGVAVMAMGLIGECVMDSGTSFSTPHVAAIVAMLI
ncbi:subtilisin-like protease sbt3.3 [Phtheirospermum japonicum]|uniref:Subtilisin-like protease sbt3.3 n=1 Tax=Phtheirospermum japonicum TaxID=374723 RepID=A0A830CLS5_9LAMI|nr:subtilisin-like protease sbt3.3 [Phtheirospermum japonicum]